MTTDLNEMTATPRVIHIGETEHKMYPMTLKDQASLNIFMEDLPMKQAKLFCEKLIDYFGKEVAQPYIDEVVKDTITKVRKGDSTEAMEHPDGFVELLFLTISRGDSKITRDYIKSNLTQVNLDELRVVFEKLNHVDKSDDDDPLVKGDKL